MRPLIFSHFIKKTAVCVGLCCLAALSVFPTYVAGNSQSAWVRIGEGRLNSAEWISTLGHKGGAGSTGVCVSTSLAVKKHDGVDISEAFECGSARDSTPLIQFVGGHSQNGPRSVFAVIFSSAARKIAVYLDKENKSRATLKRVSKDKARQLRIEQLGYWVHAFAGPICIRKMVAYDENGLILSEGKFGC